jgi:hypothetical protein
MDGPVFYDIENRGSRYRFTGGLLLMAEFGLRIIPGKDMTRIKATCNHQSGLIYVVPAERSWICSSENLAAHALAGLFRELVALQDRRVEEAMLEWGIYYRQLPLDIDENPAEALTDTG